MDTKLGEAGAATSEADESIDRNAGGGMAWCITQSKDLQLWHRPCQADDDIIIHPRRATIFAGELDVEIS